MWKFLKRQFKTKTGKLMCTAIVTSAIGAATGEVNTTNAVLNIGAELLNSVGQNNELVGLGALAIMFLRDKEAKKEQKRSRPKRRGGIVSPDIHAP